MEGPEDKHTRTIRARGLDSDSFNGLSASENARLSMDMFHLSLQIPLFSLRCHHLFALARRAFVYIPASRFARQRQGLSPAVCPCKTPSPPPTRLLFFLPPCTLALLRHCKGINYTGQDTVIITAAAAQCAGCQLGISQSFLS